MLIRILHRGENISLPNNEMNQNTFKQNVFKKFFYKLNLFCLR